MRYNYGLRGSKGTVYEGGIRVPAFVRWPGILVPGRLSAPLAVQDLLPTLLEAIQAPAPPAAFDGRSFWAALAQPEVAVEPRYVFQQQTPQETAQDPQPFENACIIGSRYKLLFPSPSDAPELYDLFADRGETRNIAGEQPERMAEMNFVALTCTSERCGWPEVNPTWSLDSRRRAEVKRR